MLSGISSALRACLWSDTKVILQLLKEGCNFVARSGELIAGHAVYTPTNSDEPELAVFVNQEYQNRGLGTELCKHVIATARAGDRDGLVLEVEPRNHVAIRIYEKLRFERVEKSSAPNGDELRVEALRMRLPLTKATAVES